MERSFADAVDQTQRKLLPLIPIDAANLRKPPSFSVTSNVLAHIRGGPSDRSMYVWTPTLLAMEKTFVSSPPCTVLVPVYSIVGCCLMGKTTNRVLLALQWLAGSKLRCGEWLSRSANSAVLRRVLFLFLCNRRRFTRRKKNGPRIWIEKVRYHRKPQADRTNVILCCARHHLDESSGH